MTIDVGTTPRKALTQEYLRSILIYDPETGLWTWKISNPSGGLPREGDRAGCLDAAGYRVIGIDKKVYRGCRLAWFYMTGEWPSTYIDHIDMNKSNDTWSNLREASHAQNQQNRTRYRNNTSGSKGVTWCKAASKWQAQITYDRKHHYLGLYESKEDAAAAYQAESLKHHGDFGRVE